MFTLSAVPHITLPSGFPCLSDVPPNVKIESFGPAAMALRAHDEDVIVLCKRYCSDRELCQAQCRMKT